MDTYEKKYNEALERARIKRDEYRRLDPKSYVPQDIEYIFPELRESEDERIRKEIIDFLETIPASELKRIPRPISEWFSWLEKQKEQKPAEYLDKDKIYAIMKKLHDLSFSQTIIINSKEYKQIDEITHDVRSLLDYPIKQKLAWSEEDETIIEGACSALEIYGHTKLASRLKSLRPSWKPSEEQMEALYNTFYTCSVGAKYRDILESLYEQLKKL